MKIHCRKLGYLQGKSSRIISLYYPKNKVVSVKVYYEVSGLVGTETGAMGLLPITLTSQLVAGHSILFDKAPCKKKLKEE